jgi:hypothetical protein
MLLAILFATTVAGCAGRTEVTSLANQSSSVLNDYKREMAAFARRQTALSQDNARRISDFRQANERQQMFLGRIIQGWQFVNDKGALAMYSGATQLGAEQILAGSEALHGSSSAVSQVSTVKFDAGQVDGLIKRLKAIEKAPSYWDNVVFALSYNDALRAAYQDSLKKAGDEAEEAESQAETSATEAIPPI